MRRKGDHDGADIWLRIIVAIGEFGEPRQRSAIDANALLSTRAHHCFLR
jgi:hypothetical protein